MGMRTNREFLECLNKMGENFKRTGNYRQLYATHASFEEDYWLDKTHKSYEADLWYNRNRNKISLEMLGDICEGKKVLAIGARHWIEGELLSAIKCKELIRTDLIPDIENGVIEADVNALPFEDASFDVVIIREVIEHVTDEQVAYAEVKRVLNPQGYMLISTPNSFLFLPDGIFHVRAYTPNSFINELEKQGFEIIKKRGNVPYILSALLPLVERGFPGVLAEFQKIDEQTNDCEARYYLCSQMFALCRKGVEK